MIRIKLMKMKKIAILVCFLSIFFSNTLISSIFAGTKNSILDSDLDLLASSDEGAQLENDRYLENDLYIVSVTREA